MAHVKTDILSEISTLIRVIEDQHPELQKYLHESRSTLPQGNLNKGKMDDESLKEYRDYLKGLIQKHAKKS